MKAIKNRRIDETENSEAKFEGSNSFTEEREGFIRTIDGTYRSVI